MILIKTLTLDVWITAAKQQTKHMNTNIAKCRINLGENIKATKVDQASAN